MTIEQRGAKPTIPSAVTSLPMLFVLLVTLLGGCSHSQEFRRLAEENTRLKAELEHAEWLLRFRWEPPGHVGMVISSRSTATGTVVEMRFDLDALSDALVELKKGASLHILRGECFVGLVRITQVSQPRATGELDVAFSVEGASPVRGDDVWPVPSRSR